MSRSALDRIEQKQIAAARMQMAAVYSGSIAPGMMPGMVPGMVPGMPYGVPGMVSLYDEGDTRRDLVEQVGNRATFNVNKLLFDRIVESDYYKHLLPLRGFQEITQEASDRVTHVEPWSAGTSRTPSTAWVLLVKLFECKLTARQVNSLIRRRGQPLVRALGFLYLRVVTDPKKLWEWCEEFVDDPEEFNPAANPDLSMTVGRFVMKLLQDMNYYNTMLPRIPVPTERKIKAFIILLEDEQRRAADNMHALHLLKPGAKIQAIYKDEETEPAFYPATLVELLPPEDEGLKPKVVVRYDEYDMEDTIALGKVLIPEDLQGQGRDHGRDGGNDRGRSHRSRESGGGGSGCGGSSRRRSRSRSRDRIRDRDRDRDGEGGRRDDRRGKDRGDAPRRPPPTARGEEAGGGGKSLVASAMAKATERDRDRSAAQGKDYAQRPASYKGSLSLKLDRFTHRKKSRSRSPDLGGGGGSGNRPGGGYSGGLPSSSTRTEDGRRRDMYGEQSAAREQRRERDYREAERSDVYERGSRKGGDDGKLKSYLKDRYGDAAKH